MGPDANGRRANKTPTTENTFPISLACTFFDMRERNIVVEVESNKANAPPMYSIHSFTQNAITNKFPIEVNESGIRNGIYT